METVTSDCDLLYYFQKYKQKLKTIDVSYICKKKENMEIILDNYFKKA